MIVDIFFTILGWLMQLVAFFLPSWTIWPDDLLTGLSYAVSSLGKLNFIFPIDTLLTCLLFLINFEVLYFTAKIVVKFFNWIRGASGIDI